LRLATRLQTSKVELRGRAAGLPNDLLTNITARKHAEEKRDRFSARRLDMLRRAL
jgi:hypothetical protein